MKLEQSVPITTNAMSSNPVHGEVYSIQHYVIKFVSDFRQVGGFLRVPRFPPPIKLTATEILLKVALNTINQTINIQLNSVMVKCLADNCFVFLFFPRLDSNQQCWYKAAQIRLAFQRTRRLPLLEQELISLPEHVGSPPVFSGVRVARSLVFCVVFCRSLFIILSLFSWSFCCLFFDLRILIIPLVSSNYSYPSCLPSPRYTI
jgi:hypothetical protein